MIKKIILFIFILLIFAPVFAFDSDFSDLDMDFIDDPYKGQKFVTDDEFNNAIETLQGNKREPTKFTKWLFGIKDVPKQEEKPAVKPAPSETNTLRDAITSNQLIRLYVPILDSYGHILPVGHYVAQHKHSNNGSDYILLIQGGRIVGCFIAYKMKDNYAENAIIYARLDYNATSEFIKIIVSDFEFAYGANAKIVK